MGVIGMNLDDGDEVVGMQIDSQGEYLLVVSEKGMGKRTLTDEFKVQKRSGKGVLCYKITDKTGDLVGAKLVYDDREILLITKEGIIIRNTSGVKMMNIDQDSNIRVASIAKVRESSSDVSDDNDDSDDSENKDDENLENEGIDQT